jgi:hypothetical protein
MIPHVTCIWELLVLLLSLSVNPQFLRNRDGGIVVDLAGDDSLSLLLELTLLTYQGL